MTESLRWQRFLRLVWAAILVAAGPAAFGVAMPTRPIVLTQLPAGGDIEQCVGRGEGTLPCDYGDGARLVRLEPDGSVLVLAEGFHSACEPDVSFDGKRILFAGKRHASDHWNIWEMNTDGSGVRQVTRDAENCRTPIYLSTFYTIVSTEPWFQILFASDVAGKMDDSGSGVSRSLYSCRLDGTELRRITVNISDDSDPYLLADGRVVLSSWQRMDLRRGALGRVALFGVNTDGIDYALYHANGGKRVKHMACCTTDGKVVYVEADKVGWDGAGQLAATSLIRPLHTYQTITDDAKHVYLSPSPLPDGTLLVSRRPTSGDGTHALCRLDPATGEITSLYDDPAYHDIHARLIAPRPKPDGRSSVVDEERKTAVFYCLDVYNADPSIKPHLKRGMVKQIRVIEGAAPEVPHNKDDRSARGIPNIVPRRVLGEVPVESDGSFHIETFPDTPIQLQALDKDGLALESCGWIWVKHRESRGCIGCHEDPELTPENRMVDAVKKPGIKVLPSPEQRRTVDFKHNVLPIVEERCSTTACHGGGVNVWPESDSSAEGYHDAYMSLLSGVGEAKGSQPVRGKYVVPGEARTSPLIWRLYGRNTSRPWDRSGVIGQPIMMMPPPQGHDILTDEELRVFAEWIDLGALWDSTSGD